MRAVDLFSPLILPSLPASKWNRKPPHRLSLTFLLHLSSLLLLPSFLSLLLLIFEKRRRTKESKSSLRHFRTVTHSLSQHRHETYLLLVLEFSSKWLQLLCPSFLLHSKSWIQTWQPLSLSLSSNIWIDSKIIFCRKRILVLHCKLSTFVS